MSLSVLATATVGMLRLYASRMATAFLVESRKTISDRLRGVPRSDPAGLNLCVVVAWVAWVAWAAWVTHTLLPNTRMIPPSVSKQYKHTHIHIHPNPHLCRASSATSSSSSSAR
jgi:hypothetical protein